MSGIIFFRTRMLDKLKEFYTNHLECTIWMDQEDCIILQHENLLLGFCQREESDLNGMITFYYPSKKDVDELYRKFKSTADKSPRDNPRYPIYHFFARDPENRILEFQFFYNL
jgi:hypothetical protein